MTCLTRARSAVNTVAGAPVPKPATAMRSEGDSRSMNAFAARAMPIARPQPTTLNAKIAKPAKVFLLCGLCGLCVPSTRQPAWPTTSNAELAESAEIVLFCGFCGFCVDRSFGISRSFHYRHTIALPRANIVLTVDVDLDPPPRIVAGAVGRHVPEQILIPQLVEQIGERLVQLVDVVGEERAPAGRRRDPVHHSLQ